MASLPVIIEQPSANRDRLMPVAPDHDTKYRLGSFIEWLDKVDPDHAWHKAITVGAGLLNNYW